MGSVSVTISKEDHYNGMRITYPMEGVLIKMNPYKRIYAKVLGINKDSGYAHSLRCTVGYKPAPKSTLRNKSVFSKFKMPII